MSRVHSPRGQPSRRPRPFLKINYDTSEPLPALLVLIPTGLDATENLAQQPSVFHELRSLTTPFEMPGEHFFFGPFFSNNLASCQTYPATNAFNQCGGSGGLLPSHPTASSDMSTSIRFSEESKPFPLVCKTVFQLKGCNLKLRIQRVDVLWLKSISVSNHAQTRIPNLPADRSYPLFYFIWFESSTAPQCLPFLEQRCCR